MADKAAAPKKAAPRKAAAAKKADTTATPEAAPASDAASPVVTRSDIPVNPPTESLKAVKLVAPGGTNVTAPERIVDKLKRQGFKTR